MPKFTVGEGADNRILLLMRDVETILKGSSIKILQQARDLNGITIGYNQNRAISPAISVHSGKFVGPFPAVMVVLVQVRTVGAMDDEQNHDLISMASAVYDTLIDDDNRLTPNEWNLVTDEVPWVPAEGFMADRGTIEKVYQLAFKYRWSGAYG